MPESRLVVVPLGGDEPDSATVLVEVDPEPGMVRVARPGEALARSAESLQQSLRRLRGVTALVSQELAQLPHRPERLVVQFGVKLGVEAGIAITKASGEANLVVTLEWSGAEGPGSTD